MQVLLALVWSPLMAKLIACSLSQQQWQLSRLLLTSQSDLQLVVLAATPHMQRSKVQTLHGQKSKVKRCLSLSLLRP